MQSHAVLGWRLLAVASLIAVAACTNASQSASNSAASTAGAGGAEAVTGNMNSVNAVSDALGRRLDGMLVARQASR
jgi:hypothetical protein